MESTLIDLKTRRSVRKFKSEQIKKEELEKILEAGTYAPTGKNMQSPIIVVVQDKEKIEQLEKINGSFFDTKVEHPFYGAPTVLIVLADKNRFTYIEDGSLVLGNMMIAAHSIGIGSCWIHRAKEEFETEEGKEFLKEWGISENYVGIGHCILGYPSEDIKTEARPRKEDYIRYV